MFISNTTNTFTTKGYNINVATWPEELDLHAIGLEPTNTTALYFDDFAVRLKGRDPLLR